MWIANGWCRCFVWLQHVAAPVHGCYKRLLQVVYKIIKICLQPANKFTKTDIFTTITTADSSTHTRAHTHTLTHNRTPHVHWCWEIYLLTKRDIHEMKTLEMSSFTSPHTHTHIESLTLSQHGHKEGTEHLFLNVCAFLTSFHYKCTTSAFSFGFFTI